jgi:gamma-glutamyltranspeptidase/glutathione hydrolase
MMITNRGIVATSQMLASQAGAQILGRGGSAIDAAIAANAVLGVTEPSMCGIGGDLFVLYWDAKAKKLTGLNASGPAPAGLTIDFLKKQGIMRMPDSGIHSATVPGAVEGWEKLHRRYGRLPWRDLFQPAIWHAEKGFQVAEMMAQIWNGSDYLPSLSRDKNAEAVFLPDGKAPATGDLFRNRQLANAYRLIAAGGAAVFYKGAIADAIVQTSRRLGGTMRAPDLAAFTSEWVEPISTTYHGWTVYELPPNGHGIAALQMLSILERFPLRKLGFLSVDALHLEIEAMKVAYADLRHVGDQRFVKVPVAGMLSKEYAEARASLIQSDHAKCYVSEGKPPTSDTTYLAVVDKDGNIASVIQSISNAWGSGVLVEGMGFLLHNRGQTFELDPEHPNALMPGKRPRHTIIPAMMEKDELRIGFGIMGGLNQPMAHAQFVSNIVDHGMNIQAALDAPRFTKREFGGCNLLIETRVPKEIRDALEAKGHDLKGTAEYDGFMGRGQAVLHNSQTGVNYGASSPRGDGAAFPEPINFWSPNSR